MNKRYLQRTIVLIFVIFMTTVFSGFAETITTTAQGGLWDSESTWIGGKLPGINDNVIITSVVTTGNVSYTSRTFIMANLTVNAGGKIIREKEKPGRYALEVHGNLVNNGEIIDYKDYFDIYLYGNLENNGVFKPRLFYLSGEKQHISTTKPIECKTFNLAMTDNELIASSNLQFKNCYIPANGTKMLNMGSFNLSLQADSVTYDSYYGEIYSNSKIYAPIKFKESGIIELDKSIIGKTIYGNCILKSPSYAFITDLTVEGNLTISENTKVSSNENLIKLIVKGDFTNYSEINKDSVHCPNIKAPVRSMRLYVYGNSNNIGTTGTTTTLYPISNGDTISLKGNFTGDVEIRQAENSTKPGGKVVIDGDVSIGGDLYIYSNLEITKAATLNMLTRTIYNPIYVGSGLGTITNNGNINRYHRVSNAWGNRTFDNPPGMSIRYELRDWTDRIEGVDVSVFNGKTYPNLPGSVKRWWRLKPVGAGKVKTFTLKLFYDEALLNGQKESNLKVFQSTDEGENWKVVSLGQYAKLDTIENSITIGDWSKAESMLSEFGDFVISSGDGTVPIPSPVVLKLIGRNKVREGGPNRYTVQMYNVSDTEPSGSFFVSVNLDGDVRFLGAEIPAKNGVEVLPIDSIGKSDDNTLAFYVPYLNPKEESSFDVIIQGIPSATKSTTIAPVVIWVAGVAVIGATSVVADYVTDYLVDKTELSQQQKADLSDATGIELKVINSHKVKEDKTTYAMKTTVKAVMEKLSKFHPVSDAAFSIGDKLEMLSKFGPNLRYRLMLWGKSWMNQDGKNELRLLEGDDKSLEKVKSLDPNEKTGPAGVGSSNYISSAGRMYYNIAFENKKEATAPAYRVQIVDTLSAVFNPETVIFGATSHAGTQYNWKMERVGNVLKWDIEGIELMPNANPPEGEGYVSFSVELKEGLQSGVPIANKATIVFDLNQPITTNTWTNIIDKIAPVTVMNPIAYSAGDTLINISCTASDNVNGSGIGKYQFFASIDNAPFKFIGESFENTMQYQVQGTEKHNYRFYVLTTDNVNNSEKSVPAMGVLNTLLVSAETHRSIDNNITVYPNPTSNFINIDFSVEESSHVEFLLYSITGKLIKTSGMEWFNTGKHHLKIDISSFAEGVYLTEVILNKKANVFKVVKK